MKKNIGLFVVLVLILIFAVFAIRWIEHRMKYVISDAVFVETDYLSNLGFNRVSGKIIQLYKKEGDAVKADETIAKIDDTDYKIQLENINYEIESLKQQKSQLENQLSRIIQENELNQKITSLTTQEIEKKIESLSAQKSQVEAQIEKAKKDEERYRNLLEKGLVPKAKYEEINTQLKVLLDQKKAIEKSISELNLSKAKSKETVELVKTQGQVSKEIQDQISALENKILALTKQKEDLENQIKYTELKSPYNGIIAKKYVSIGDIVKAGQPVYAIVKENSFYIKVLLEETKLSGVKVGNKAYIKLDAYPDKTFEGVVESIDIASAAKFALVPRDISAGEFTKLAQRIPVKIRITKGDMGLLRVGLGGEVEIEKK
ncbi:HlyD family secretion protein [Sulfurihydrogenibium yellowstonense]|uniref:Multidrug-efflux transporter, MFS family n=1 Tax=Sulfurihydrogenibium yellowstonense SS-5 TaxID=432331 RepID=C4FIK8_9AQUI|nr:HlyD family secretion protein [Sulfurihydrogenibium yellowstonense]EEP61089.1 multidrug-efflux transporter, MFS family [Sulfurihydrogenibium yellowstonense SS-5]